MNNNGRFNREDKEKYTKSIKYGKKSPKKEKLNYDML